MIGGVHLDEEKALLSGWQPAVIRVDLDRTITIGRVLEAKDGRYFIYRATPGTVN